MSQRSSTDVTRTFFADETVIAVVGIVGIAQTAMRVFKLEEFVPVFA
jgi:hypothetical protein